MKTLILTITLAFLLPPSTASSVTKRRLACETGEVMVGITKGKKVLCKSILDVLHEAITKEAKSDRALSYPYPFAGWIRHYVKTPNPLLSRSKDGSVKLDLPSTPLTKRILHGATVRRQCAQKAVTHIGGNSYRVDRSHCPKQFGDDSYARQARFIPHVLGGKTQGFKVIGIRAETLFARMGLKSGDIIKSCNNVVLNGVNGVMFFFDTIRTEKTLKLELMRRNKTLILIYALTGPSIP